MSLRIGGFRHSRMLAKPNSFDRLKESNKLPIKWMAIETLMEKKFTCYNDGMSMCHIYNVQCTHHMIGVNLV